MGAQNNTHSSQPEHGRLRRLFLPQAATEMVGGTG